MFHEYKIRNKIFVLVEPIFLADSVKMYNCLHVTNYYVTSIY